MMSTQTPPKKMSPKHTKNEILAAYEALYTQARELHKKNRQQQQALENQEKLVAAANEQTPTGIQQHLSALRQQMNEQIDSISAQFNTETQRLETIQQAIEIEEANLQAMYEINKTAHSLDTLLLAHQQEAAQFQQQMDEKRSQWKKEQETATQAMKAAQEGIRKAWQREQEEYAYQTKLSRQKDQDAYQTQKAKQEKALEQQKERLHEEFRQREEHLLAQETQLSELKEKVAQFPEQLESALVERERLISERLNREHQFQFDLLSKEREGEQQLSHQTIASLELKLKAQDQLIAELSKKVTHSAVQVQAIALKAIEGASSTKNVYYPVEKTKATEA